MERNFKLKDHFVQRNKFVREKWYLKTVTYQFNSPGMDNALGNKSIDQIMKGNTCLASGLVVFLPWACFSN